MTKTITIDWKGGSRRIELQDPGKMKRLHHLATAPTPLQMDPKSLGWINATLVIGTDLGRDKVESMKVSGGFDLLGEVMGYWKGLRDGAAETDSDKGGESPLEGIELDDQGAVDLGDMQ